MDALEYLNYNWRCAEIAEELEAMLHEPVEKEQVEATIKKILSETNLRPSSEFRFQLVELCVRIGSGELGIQILDWFYENRVGLDTASIDRILSLVRFFPAVSQFYPELCKKAKEMQAKNFEDKKAEVKNKKNTKNYWVQFFTSPSKIGKNCFIEIGDRFQINKESRFVAESPIVESRAVERAVRLRNEVSSKSNEEILETKIEDSVLFEVIIDELCNRRLYSSAIQTLEKVDKKILSINSLRALVPIGKYHLEKGDILGIMNLIQKMAELELSPTIEFFNILIEFHVQTKNWLEALNVFIRLPSYRLSPNIDTINIMLLMCYENRDLFTARALLSEMNTRWEIEPNDETWRYILYTCQFFDDETNAKYCFSNIEVHNTKDYIVLMKLHSKRNNCKEMLDIFEKMEKSKIPQNNKSFASIVRYFCQCGQHHALLKILEHFKNVHNLFLNQVTFLAIVADSLNQGKLDVAFKLEDFRSEHLKNMLNEFYVYTFCKCLASDARFTDASRRIRSSSENKLLTSAESEKWKECIDAWKERLSVTLDE
ncbi:uncharacterized protein LOC126317106 [Schistocerca gregaria]|uniref:uncharacterized protein LOC126317106 n=1 Tax=Schistocerca gregaria TaxID=7010 RepID=UPI00211DDF6E|nr:uncharacterized protein LOC126317106 [Schistocerca gregaria]